MKDKLEMFMVAFLTIAVIILIFWGGGLFAIDRAQRCYQHTFNIGYCLNFEPDFKE